MMDQSILFYSAQKVFSCPQVESISVSQAQSFWPAFNPLTFSLASVQIGPWYELYSTLETLLTVLPTGTTLAWRGEEVSGLWASFTRVQILWGQLLSPESWYDQWSVAGCWVHLMRDSGVTVIYLPPSILTASFCAFSLLCCTQDLIQAWVAIGLIQVGLETENLAPAGTLEFVASGEILNFDLLCNPVVYLPDPVLVQVHHQSCWIEPATVQVIWSNS